MPGKVTPLRLYFYSNRNIVGSALGIGAAALAALGIIQDYWALLVAGSYGAGALLTPANQRMDVSLAREMSDRDIIAGLGRIARDAPKLLPAAVALDVASICEMLAQAIPAVAQLSNSAPLAFDVRTTATEYLPQTLERYLRMPPAFRASVRDRDGKTPASMLAEQIRLLKAALISMLNDLASADADRIAANGLFLKEKFATPAFAEMS